MNLKTHLIIKISKGLAIDGKQETKGRAYENWLDACLKTDEALQMDAHHVKRATRNGLLIRSLALNMFSLQWR